MSVVRCPSCNTPLRGGIPCACQVQAQASQVQTPEVVIDAATEMATRTVGLWTRDRALRAMGFDYAHLGHAYARTREALDAVAPERLKVKTLPNGVTEETLEHGGAPDWPVRLKAADQLFGLGGVRQVELDPDERKAAPLTIKVVIGEVQASRPSTVTAVSVRVPQP